MYKRTDCRCCHGSRLTEVFDLGDQPFANALLSREQLDQEEQLAPLVLMECDDCRLVQLKHVVEASHLYRNYSFLTSSSKRMLGHFAELMRVGIETYVATGGLVVEIGSNDGATLSSISDGTVRRIGVDPAINLSKLAMDRGIFQVTDFFTNTLAEQIVAANGQADLIVACNVLAHVDDLDDFCLGIKRLLSPTGAFIVEVPYVNRLIEQTEFDTIYHEHLSYFGVRPLEMLFMRHGLRIQHVSEQDVHGGSLRVTIRHGNGYAMNAVEFFQEEQVPRNWFGFNSRVQNLRSSFCRWLARQAAKNKTVWGYGAAAKSTVLLNYCNVGTDLLPFVADSTKEKQGRYIPGTRQLIVKTEELLCQMPSFAVVFPWNHLAEITDRESAYIRFGGCFVVPSEVNARE